MMLTLIEEPAQKEAAQAKLEERLKSFLMNEGTRSIGYRGGKADCEIYSAGAGKLWVAFSKPVTKDSTPRYWNPFGISEPNGTLTPIVEINIPTDGNSARVAGFFAEDTETRDIYLMHSGGIAGGRKGISKSKFLEWSNVDLAKVARGKVGFREGIQVANLDDPNLVECIWAYVSKVQAFKDQAVNGGS
jgi:hypothetical protein